MLVHVHTVISLFYFEFNVYNVGVLPLERHRCVTEFLKTVKMTKLTNMMFRYSVNVCLNNYHESEIKYTVDVSGTSLSSIISHTPMKLLVNKFALPSQNDFNMHFLLSPNINYL